MIDFLLGFAFVAMILSPPLVRRCSGRAFSEINR